MEDVARRRFRRALAVSAWVALGLYAGLIFYLSSRSGGSLPRHWLLEHDKFLHGCVYFVFGLLGVRALRASGFALGPACLLAVLLGFAYGVSDEWHQSFVPGRQGNDWGDIAADTVGAGLAAATSALAAALRRPSRRALA